MQNSITRRKRGIEKLSYDDFYEYDFNAILPKRDTEPLEINRVKRVKFSEI